MAYSRYRKSMEQEQRWLCLMIAVLAAMELFFTIPAEHVIAELRNSDSPYAVHQEIWITPAKH